MTTAGGTSNGLSFTVTPTVMPTLTSLSPSSGPVGTGVTLMGTGFTGGSTVSFNGTAAPSVTFMSSTSLTATVPAGAATGNVTVTTAGGTSNGLSFTVTAIPNQTYTITTIAGTPRTAGFSGDGGAATSARLSRPLGVAVDGSGNVFIADNNNYRVRKVSAATGVITTVAGTGTPGFSGDGGAATSAQLNYPYGVAVDGSGNIFFADFLNHRIRRVNGATGVITTVAGTGANVFGGDGGPATSAQLAEPTGMAIGGGGKVFITDEGNDCIRLLTPASATSALPALSAAAVQLYPNPARGAVTVLVPAVAGAAAVQAELLNALGQPVRRQVAATGAPFTVETAGLAPGVYTLRLQAGATTLAKRLVVQ